MAAASVVAVTVVAVTAEAMAVPQVAGAYAGLDCQAVEAALVADSVAGLVAAAKVEVGVEEAEACKCQAHACDPHG